MALLTVGCAVCPSATQIDDDVTNPNDALCRECKREYVPPSERRTRRRVDFDSPAMPDNYFGRCDL